MPLTTPDMSIGERIAAARILAGLSQLDLADRAGVSHSLLSKVESGHRPATPVLVAAVARALHVEPTHLTGQPYRDTGRKALTRAHSCVPALRQVLLTTPHADAVDGPVRPIDELRRVARRVHGLRIEAKISAMAEPLPSLVADLQRAAYRATGIHDREVLYGMLADAYEAAQHVVYKLGHLDLSALLTERYRWAAERSGDPMRVTIARMFGGGDLVVAGAWDTGYRVLTQLIAQFEPSPGTAAPHELSVYGTLHLRAALAAARRAAAGTGTTAAIDPHLDEAREVGRLAGERNDYDLVFGPANVSIFAVAVAVETGDGTTAVARARGLRLPNSLSRERRSHHLIDLARGWLYHGNRERALHCLVRARRVAPEQTRAHPMTRETVRALAFAEARHTDSLAGFAQWVGVRT